MVGFYVIPVLAPPAPIMESGQLPPTDGESLSWLAWEKQLFYGEPSKPNRIGHPICH
jgi:hypothetical protein